MKLVGSKVCHDQNLLERIFSKKMQTKVHNALLLSVMFFWFLLLQPFLGVISV